MLHILLIAEDSSAYLTKQYFYLEQELKKHVYLSIWRQGGNIQHIIKKLSEKPDFILLVNDLGDRIFPNIKGLNHINVPVGLFIHDVHRLIRIRKNYIEKHNIRHLFTTVRDAFLDTYPEFTERMEWLPHSIDTTIYKDYRLEKDINLLMLGAVNNTYPLRQTILNTYRNDPQFVYYQHPGYGEHIPDDTNQYVTGPSYAKAINRAKIFFTSPSILYYPVQKYFEALACRALLLAPHFRELEDLGFIPYVHFVPINKHNFQEQAAYYLVHETERRNIVNQGYCFVREQHTVQVRIQHLLERIREIISV